MIHAITTSRILLALLSLICLTAISARADSGDAPRRDISLNAGWKFSHDEPSGAETPGLDDSAWRQITVPHCWDVELGQTGQQAAWDASVSKPAWYRLHFKPEAALARKSLFLKFDAVYVIADVYLNGQLLGRHVGGFTAFCFDVTSRLQLGRDNVLAVKVTGKSPDNVTPPNNGGDFTKFPGIYRDVHLLALDRLSVTPLDDASDGVYLKQVSVSDAAAEIELTAKLRNGHDTAKNARVRLRILDADGKQMQTAEGETSVPAGGEADSFQTIRIERPHLWNGRLDPYLYRAEVEVSDGGAITDRVAEPLGLRYFRCDPEKGFFLNGKPYSVHGVNRHQDYFTKGWAIGPKEIDGDIALILEMGCTGLRLPHYPHCRYTHSLCDRSGLVAWSESPMVATVAASSPDFVQNTLQQVNEWVKQNFNHPSILIWSLGNEWSLHELDPVQTEFIRAIDQRIKQLDPTRLTTVANHEFRPGNLAGQAIPDILSWNYYPGWYGTADGKFKSFEEEYQVARYGWNVRFDRSRGLYPGRSVGVSEYGAGASIHHHMLHPRAPATKGRFHPEEWQAIVHEANYALFREHPELCWTLAWVFADFSSMTRNEGDQRGRNDKGLLTYDRKTKKDAFYYYQAQWASEPMVHVAGRRYTPHPIGPTEVKVYSNCDKVELFMNGRSLGTAKGAAGVFVWKVTLPAGEVQLEAVASRGAASVKDAITLSCSANVPERMEGDTKSGG
jgi:beta-galactosidase